MRTGQTKKRTLAAALCLLLAAVLLTVAGRRQEPASDSGVKLRAAQQMASCMERILSYKAELSLALSPEDLHGSGLIGDSFTGITTTIGAIEAKRTVSDANMAALMVQLLTEAGVRGGDTVAAGFSGSFPGMNLAAVCACEAMGVRIVYLSSVGASMFGANQPELTFPDMAVRLYRDGCIATPPAGISMGGDADCGLEMDPAVSEEVRQRMKSYGIPFLEEPDFAANLALRRALFEADGRIACYIGVGGNVTNSGKSGSELSSGVVPPGGPIRLTEESGLMDRYHAEGVPVIHIINIKQLAADYRFPYDPEQPPAVGSGALYTQIATPLWPAIAGGGLAAAVLAVPALLKRRRTP